MNFISIFADTVKPIKLRGTGTFHPHETGKVAENLYCIRQKDVNFWLYRKDKTVIAIDSGYYTAGAFDSALESFSIKNEEIQAILLTHGDVDHMGGLLSQKRFAPKGMLYLHEREEDMILGKAERFRKLSVKIKNPVKFSGDYQLVSDDQELNFDRISVKVLPCTGHTKGHTCYFVDDTYLFTGDSIAINQLGGHCFFDFYNMNTKENMDSLQKLKEKLKENPPKLVCTAHSGVATFETAFLSINNVAKGTKRDPFDKTAPFDVMKEEE